MFGTVAELNNMLTTVCFFHLNKEQERGKKFSYFCDVELCMDFFGLLLCLSFIVIA